MMAPYMPCATPTSIPKPRAKPSPSSCPTARPQREEATSCLFRPSLQHASHMLRTFVRAVTVEGRADAEKKFETVTEIVSAVAVESVWAIVDGELHPEPDVEAVAVRQIAYVADGVTAHWKDSRFVWWIENEFVAGFFHT